MPQSGGGLTGMKGRGDSVRKLSLEKKLEKLRRKRMIQQQIPPVMVNMYETKLRVLRKNNRALAKALSDQKVETNNWYSEAVTLKGELQEAQEKLLRLNDDSTYREVVLKEMDRQVKECCVPIDQAINLALDSMVEVVDKLTKAKQMVNSTLSTWQCSSNSSSNSSNSFSRLSGTRTPLGAGAVSPSPRQRAVLPMVSGHVLQPAMVPLPKLKITSNKRSHTQDNHFEMSVIGEQSSLNESEASTVEEEQQTPNSGRVTVYRETPEAAPSADDTGDKAEELTPRRAKLRGKSLPEPQATKVTVRRKGRSSVVSERQQTSKTPTPSPSKTLPHTAEGKKASASPSVEEEDPLEGPSWWYSGQGSRASRGRGRGRGRGRARQRHKAAHVIVDLSSDDDDDDTTVLTPPKPKQVKTQHSSPTVRLFRLPTSATQGSSWSLNNSFTSPSSMSVRIETPEDQGGHQSQENKDVNGESSTQLDLTDVNQHEETSKELSSSSQDHNESRDLLRCETDVTCQVITNMDMTMPVSNTIVQESPKASREEKTDNSDDLKGSRLRNRFFKTRGTEAMEAEEPQVKERTPFDLSMMNESAIQMPPFSSTRTTEKENLPPLPNEGDEHMTVHNVSVILKDVMKDPTYSAKMASPMKKASPGSSRSHSWRSASSSVESWKSASSVSARSESGRSASSVSGKSESGRSASSVSSKAESVSSSSSVTNKSELRRRKKRVPPKTPSSAGSKKARGARRILSYDVGVEGKEDSDGDEVWEPKRIRTNGRRKKEQLRSKSVRRSARKHNSKEESNQTQVKEQEDDEIEVVEEDSEGKPHNALAKTLKRCYVKTHRTSMRKTPVLKDDADRNKKRVMENNPDMPDLHENNPIGKETSQGEACSTKTNESQDNLDMEGNLQGNFSPSSHTEESSKGEEISQRKDVEAASSSSQKKPDSYNSSSVTTDKDDALINSRVCEEDGEQVDKGPGLEKEKKKEEKEKGEEEEKEEEEEEEEGAQKQDEKKQDDKKEEDKQEEEEEEEDAQKQDVQKQEDKQKEDIQEQEDNQKQDSTGSTTQAHHNGGESSDVRSGCVMDYMEDEFDGFEIIDVKKSRNTQDSPKKNRGNERGRKSHKARKTKNTIVAEETPEVNLVSDSSSEAEERQPRKRRAAISVKSLKEPSIRSKMRR